MIIIKRHKLGRFANKLRTLSQGTESILPVDQRYKRTTIQDETEKPSYGADRLHEGLWYGPAKLDNRLSQNVLDTRRSYKVYRKYHGKLESQNDSKRKKLNRGENLERDLPGRCALTITICNWDDATQSHT